MLFLLTYLLWRTLVSGGHLYFPSIYPLTLYYCWHTLELIYSMMSLTLLWYLPWAWDTTFASTGKSNSVHLYECILKAPFNTLSDRKFVFMNLINISHVANKWHKTKKQMLLIPADISCSNTAAGTALAITALYMSGIKSSISGSEWTRT